MTTIPANVLNRNSLFYIRAMCYFLNEMQTIKSRKKTNQMQQTIQIKFNPSRIKAATFVRETGNVGFI